MNKNYCRINSKWIVHNLRTNNTAIV